MFHLTLQAFVASIRKLKARAGLIFRNCEPPRKDDKSAIQNRLRF